VLIHVGALNLSLVMRKLVGKGTPRGWQGYSADAVLAFLRLWMAVLAYASDTVVAQAQTRSSTVRKFQSSFCPLRSEQITSATGC
jgi:hypothetical protein